MSDDPRKTEIVDELLESIYTCRERGSREVAEVLRCAHARVERADLHALEELGLARIEGECVTLSEPGEARAAALLRRHRLAERLLADVLGLSDAEAEQAACALEHLLGETGTEGLSRLLGDPAECPHGRPIPPGTAADRPDLPRALPLSEVACARRARVAFLRCADHERLHQLLSMGLSPGARIRVHQKSPMLVLEVEQAELALDRQVAGDVHVWLEPD